MSVTTDQVQTEICEIMGMCVMLVRATQALKANMDFIVGRCENVRKNLEALAKGDPDNPKFAEAAEQVAALVKNLRATVGAAHGAEKLH